MSLSDKIQRLGTHINFIYVKDAKEFIKKIKKFIDKEHQKMNGTTIKQCPHKNGNCWGHDYLKKIDREAGDKLI